MEKCVRGRACGGIRAPSFAGCVLLKVGLLCVLLTARPQLAVTCFTIPKGGPCSSENYTTLMVNNVKDIYRRQDYSNSSTVVLLFRKSLTLTDSVYLDESFSCTILQPCDSNGSPIWLKTINDSFPPLRIYNTHNVFISGINVQLSPAPPGQDASSGCNAPEQGLDPVSTCPAVHVYNSYAVSLFDFTIIGRFDIYRTAKSRFDSLIVRNPYDDPAVVRFGRSGDAGTLTSSENVLSNCEIIGTLQGILLHWGTVGVTISNNYIHNFTKFGIACGWGASFIADCFWNNIEENYIEADAENYWGDGAGIYFNGKWHNPVNWLYHNYVKGGQHCVYYDWATSGVIADGIVCIGTWDGFKINNGKFNVVRNALMVNTRQLSGWVSCQNWFQNNCVLSGRPWMDGIARLPSADLFYKMYPRYLNICTDTAINGVPCNPPQTLKSDLWNSTLAAPASATGNCSGLPTENSIDLILVNVKPLWAPLFRNCNESVPTVPLLNTLTWLAYNSSDLLFDDEANEDFGISNTTSPIFKDRPDFQPVWRNKVGIQAPNETDVFLNFNKRLVDLPFIMWNNK